MFLAVILPFIFHLKLIITGAMPFWYDPARDLLLAWDNLSKPTLIGQPSGIPGIFYGPQWIWILSLGLIFSKDPRFVVFLTHFLPYFIIMPLFLYVLSKDLFSRTGSIVLWLLFIFAFGGYTTQIWNPNLAPLVFFLILFLFYKTKFILEDRSLLNFFLLGFIQGLLLNLHMSFGMGITVSWIIYFISILIMSFWPRRRPRPESLLNWFMNCLVFGLGFLLMFSPFLLFELRHGFMQIKSLFFTLSQSFIHNQAVVNQIGLTKTQILIKFINRLTDLLSVSNKLSISSFALLIIGMILIYLKKKKEKISENKMIVFLLFNSCGILLVYLTAKNPVWDYHFIGVEIIFLFFVGILMKKYPFFEKILTVWALLLLFFNIYKFGLSFDQKQKSFPELMVKRATVEKIYQDASGQSFGYFGKNAAIYTFDYNYMFRWIGLKPDNSANIIYLIIPKDQISDKVGFTENRTPNEKYKTVKQWSMPDKTLVIKRELKKSK